MSRGVPIAILGCVWALTTCASRADAADSDAATGSPEELPPIIVQSSAIRGSGIDADKVPGNVQFLDAGDLTRQGSASLTTALNARLGSVNVDDNLDDPFQPDILYRGFEASPVLGTPQGLAVYQNGVRINEAFGDTVNWDLFPDIAIARVQITSADPVYGLNALGGGISLTMKDGFTYQGGEAELSGGSFGQRSVVGQYGAQHGDLALYVAAKTLDESGWRMFSSDSLRQLYSALSGRFGPASVDLTYTHANTYLYGQGSAPVQELDISRSLVFTGPQNNINDLNFLTLSASTSFGSGWQAQALSYYRQFGQRVSNGNTTNDTACTTPGATGFLCQSDGQTLLTGPGGAPLPDISQGGTLPIGENDFESIHAYGRGGALQLSQSSPLAGHGNAFTSGITLDQATVDFSSGAQVGVINPQLLVQPSNLFVHTPEGGAFSATPVGLHAGNQHWGFYAKDVFDITQRMSATLSARYNIATINLEDRHGSALTGDNRYTHFNPAGGLTYKVSRRLTAYAGASQNTRTPTASEIECSNPALPCLLPSNLAGDPPTLRQVVARTIEVGLRGGALDADRDGGLLRWNLGLFRILSEDDIYGIATSFASGFFQNVGSTRRQGLEAGVEYHGGALYVFGNYSMVDATFRSPLLLPSRFNPFRDANGDITVRPGDQLPGIPRQRIKLGIDYQFLTRLTVGATGRYTSSRYYFGDESNQLGPMPGYTLIDLHGVYQLRSHVELFASVANLLNARYASYGLLSDPTGVGAPGIPAGAATNGPGVDNRFQSPGAPIAVYGGIRLKL